MSQTIIVGSPIVTTPPAGYTYQYYDETSAWGAGSPLEFFARWNLYGWAYGPSTGPSKAAYLPTPLPPG